MKKRIFININSGAIEEAMLIRNETDLDDFKGQYGITGDIKKIY